MNSKVKQKIINRMDEFRTQQISDDTKISVSMLNRFKKGSSDMTFENVEKVMAFLKMKLG